MEGQYNIFDYIGSFNPLKAVIQTESGCRKEKIVEAAGTKEFTATVKKSYCPYGFNGRWNVEGHQPNTLHGYDMTNDGIHICYRNEKAEEVRETFTWSQFANEIKKMIGSGEYRVGDEE